MSEIDRIKIASIGKSVGLSGDLKLHLESDFPSQFKKGAKFFASNEDSLTSNEKELIIESYNRDRSLVRFVGINSKNEAQKLTNLKLFTTTLETKKMCVLKKDEFFWFDVVGCFVYENGLKLGVIRDIDRIGAVDYLYIDTDIELQNQSLPKTFMIPYIDKYIIKSDVTKKLVETTGAYDILEAS